MQWRMCNALYINPVQTNTAPPCGNNRALQSNMAAKILFARQTYEVPWWVRWMIYLWGRHRLPVWALSCRYNDASWHFIWEAAWACDWSVILKPNIFTPCSTCGLKLFAGMRTRTSPINKLDLSHAVTFTEVIKMFLSGRTNWNANEMPAAPALYIRLLI